VFVAANSGIVLLSLAAISGRSVGLAAGIALGSALVLLGIGLKRRRWLTYLPIAWAAFVVATGLWLSGGAPDDRRVVAGLALLTVCEVAIVTSLATLFSSFSSPFLTAVLTFSLFVVGRSADTLAHLPPRVFGEVIHAMGVALSKVMPNLMLYVPPRPLLTGESPDVALWPYIGRAALHAAGWALLLLAAASAIFRRRDFI
jgi:hypothetical protein